MEERRLYVFTALQGMAVLVLFWLLVTWKGPWNVWRYIGTVLAITGVAFVGVARYQLGRSFSLKPEARELITGGLYSKVRNPIYVFGVVMLIGLALVLQAPQIWVVVGVAMVAQSFRARREARVLEAAFGDAYREYRRKTWF
jgi:protein-S-isoprenylcysteine O-methyltransferase Ste14